MSDDTREPIQRINKRLTEGLDDVNERIDQGFAGMRGALDQLVDQVRRGEARTNQRLEDQAATLQREFGHLEVGVGELRDRVRHLEQSALPQATASAAEGAARGAGQAASQAAAATARVTAAEVAKGFWKTTAGKVVAVGTSIAALGAGIDNLPKVIVWLSEAIHYLSKGAAK